MNGILCIYHERRREHLVRRIEHLVRRMEHPVHRKYPIVNILLGVVPIEPFGVPIKVLKKSKEKKEKFCLFYLRYDFDTVQFCWDHILTYKFKNKNVSHINNIKGPCHIYLMF